MKKYKQKCKFFKKQNWFLKLFFDDFDCCVSSKKCKCIPISDCICIMKEDEKFCPYYEEK